MVTNEKSNGNGQRPSLSEVFGKLWSSVLEAATGRATAETPTARDIFHALDITEAVVAHAVEPQVRSYGVLVTRMARSLEKKRRELEAELVKERGKRARAEKHIASLRTERDFLRTRQPPELVRRVAKAMAMAAGRACLDWEREATPASEPEAAS